MEVTSPVFQALILQSNLDLLCILNPNMEEIFMKMKLAGQEFKLRCSNLCAVKRENSIGILVYHTQGEIMMVVPFLIHYLIFVSLRGEKYKIFLFVLRRFHRFFLASLLWLRKEKKRESRGEKMEARW